MACSCNICRSCPAWPNAKLCAANNDDCLRLKEIQASKELKK